MILEIELTAVEVDDLRRLVNRLVDRNGKPNDVVRSRVLEKLRRCVTAVEAEAKDDMRIHREFEQYR